MDAEKYTRKLAMVCPTCGGDQFQYEKGVDETIQVVRCACCEREMTKDELMRENSENISAHMEEIGQEALKDAAKEIKQMLKDAFKGSDFIKVK
ncbi:MAG: hypothetical protein PHU44_11615 [Syntrophales bacterium]|nr:hypothetical protein [Syntrophales bacterium]MDD5643421.1 hypothetical protein [Syntrophales bacterium]